MGFFNFFGGASTNDEIPDIFPLSLKETDFVLMDVENIYRKVLTDTVERSQGLTNDQQALIWDNCLKSEKNDGLISLLAKSMSCKKDLFIVYDKATKVLREATEQEKAAIKVDYTKQASSNVGVYISFGNYRCTDALKIYSALEYLSVASLYKGMNISKAVQIKIEQLRASVALDDVGSASAQAVKIANNLKAGKDIMLDAKDSIETAVMSTEPTKVAMELFNQKRAFYMHMPASYVTGILNGGLSDTGKSDSKAVDRGLRAGYFYPIIKPVIFALFNVGLTFKSEDFDQLEGALEALKTFDITSNDYLSAENKTEIVNNLFGRDPEDEGDPASEPLPGETSKPTQDPPPKNAPATAAGGASY